MHACSRNALGLRVAHSYVLYERISEMCFLPAGGAYAAGMPRGVNPTTRASAGIFRKDFTFSSLKAKIQEVPNPSLVAATVTFARAMPRSRGYEFMYPPIIATASSSRAHATTTRGASAMCFAFVQAPASFRFVSSSETTMNFHGCKLSAEFANRAAFITAWTFCSGTGSGLYLLTLFTDLMASRASMSSQTVRFGVVIISVSGPLFPPGEPSARVSGRGWRVGGEGGTVCFVKTIRTFEVVTPVGTARRAGRPGRAGREEGRGEMHNLKARRLPALNKRKSRSQTRGTRR